MSSKKSIVARQIQIVVWLVFAAISAIELMKQYMDGGFKNPWVYLLFVIFAFSWFMYYRSRKNRLGDQN